VKKDSTIKGTSDNGMPSRKVESDVDGSSRNKSDLYPMKKDHQDSIPGNLCTFS